METPQGRNKMKKISIFAATLLLGSKMSAQQLAYQKDEYRGSYYSFKETDPVNTNISHLPVSIVSRNRDTLWLADNPLGRTIGNTWNLGTLPKDTQKPPVIIYIKDLTLLPTVQKNSRKKIKQ
jgi:hypothetical protein